MIRFALSIHHSGMSCSLEEHIGIGRQGRVEISGILWPQVHTRWQNERLHRSMYICKYIFACKIITQKKKIGVDQTSRANRPSSRFTSPGNELLTSIGSEERVSGRNFPCLERACDYFPFSIINYYNIDRQTRYLVRLSKSRHETGTKPSLRLSL